MNYDTRYPLMNMYMKLELHLNGKLHIRLLIRRNFLFFWKCYFLHKSNDIQQTFPSWGISSYYTVRPTYGKEILTTGIHVHIWTSQQYEPALGGSPGVGTSLADQRNNATSFALVKWRDGWVASKLHTHPAQTIGLYQEKGMMWWVLAKFLHEKKAPSIPEGGMNKWSDVERIENILRILKAIHLTVEKGGVKEENLSPEVVKPEVVKEGKDESPNPKVGSEEDGLNSMTISFIMSRKPQGS